jgi:hypothetical protein
MGKSLDRQGQQKFWAQLKKMIVPDRVRTYMRKAMWEKLPVAKRVMFLSGTSEGKCPLCGGEETHAHRHKQCRMLTPALEVIRASLPAEKRDGSRIEPSRVLVDQKEASLQSVTGLVMWTACETLWRVRNDVLFGHEIADPQVFMGRFYGDMAAWLRLPGGPLTEKQINAVRAGVASWLRGAATVRMQIEMEVRRRERHSRKAQTQADAIAKHSLLHQTPPGKIRVFVESIQQVDTEGKRQTGWGAWFGRANPANKSVHMPDGEQSRLRGELTAVWCVLDTTPQDKEITICCKQEQVASGVMEQLKKWRRRGWLTRGGQTIEYMKEWKGIANAITVRSAAVQVVAVQKTPEIEGTEEVTKLAELGASNTRETRKRSERQERPHEEMNPNPKRSKTGKALHPQTLAGPTKEGNQPTPQWVMNMFDVDAEPDQPASSVLDAEPSSRDEPEEQGNTQEQDRSDMSLPTRKREREEMPEAEGSHKHQREDREVMIMHETETTMWISMRNLLKLIPGGANSALLAPTRLPAKIQENVMNEEAARREEVQEQWRVCGHDLLHQQRNQGQEIRFRVKRREVEAEETQYRRLMEYNLEMREIHKVKQIRKEEQVQGGLLRFLLKGEKKRRRIERAEMLGWATLQLRLHAQEEMRKWTGPLRQETLCMYRTILQELETQQRGTLEWEHTQHRRNTMEKRRSQELALAVWLKRQRLKRQLEGRGETSIKKRAKGDEDHIVLTGDAKLRTWGGKSVAEKKGVG